MDTVAVLIPCFNEALTIKKVVEDFKQVIPEGGVIYVYDNNSTDDTAMIAEAAGAVVRHEYQQERVMWSDGCSVKLTPNVILW